MHLNLRCRYDNMRQRCTIAKGLPRLVGSHHVAGRRAGKGQGRDLGRCGRVALPECLPTFVRWVQGHPPFLGIKVGQAASWCQR